MATNSATTMKDVLLRLQISGLSKDPVKADDHTFFNKYRPFFPSLYVLAFVLMTLLQCSLALTAATLIFNESVEFLTIIFCIVMLFPLHKIIGAYIHPQLKYCRWKKCRWDSYKGFVPNDVKRRAMEIKDRYPAATFFIHWLQRGGKKLAVLFFVCDAEGNQYPLWDWKDD